MSYVRTYVAISTAQELHHPRNYVRTYVRTYIRTCVAADSSFTNAMGGGVRNALFQKMAKKQQDDALSILEHLCADDVQVCGRWFTDGQRGFQDVKQINGYAKCILSRINEESPSFLEIEPCDLEFDRGVCNKICETLRTIVSRIKVPFEAELPEYDYELELKDMEQGMERAIRLITRLKSTPQKRCLDYHMQMSTKAAKHKEALMEYGRLSIEGLGKTDSENDELKRNLEVHDWSKFCMPLYFAGDIYDPDLGSCLAGEFKRDSKDPMLQAFFNCVAIHNILEGSTKDGHHEGIRVLGTSTASSKAIVQILDNGTPTEMRVLEGIIDGLEAFMSGRYILPKESCDVDPWLRFHFEEAAPKKKTTNRHSIVPQANGARVGRKVQHSERVSECVQ